MRRIRLLSRNEKRAEETGGDKSESTGKGPLAKGGIKKSS
jgi:hypothetical protein